MTVWITTNWKILKEMGISDHLTCLLRNLYAGQEARDRNIEQWTGSKLGTEYVPITCPMRNLYASQEAKVRTGHGTTDWFQIGKGLHHGCILSPCLFNFYAEYIMRNAGLEEAQAGINHLRQKMKRN